MSRRNKAKALCTFTQVTNATGYKIFWGTASHSYLYSANLGSSLNYTVTGLQRGKVYYFSGKAYNAQGDSTFGNEVRHVA